MTSTMHRINFGQFRSIKDYNFLNRSCKTQLVDGSARSVATHPELMDSPMLMYGFSSASCSIFPWHPVTLNCFHETGYPYLTEGYMSPGKHLAVKQFSAHSLVSLDSDSPPTQLRSLTCIAREQRCQPWAFNL